MILLTTASGHRKTLAAQLSEQVIDIRNKHKPPFGGWCEVNKSIVSWLLLTSFSRNGSSIDITGSTTSGNISETSSKNVEYDRAAALSLCRYSLLNVLISLQQEWCAIPN